MYRSLYRGSTVINIMHGCGKSVKSERGSAPREGRQCLKLFIEERESYLI